MKAITRRLQRLEQRIPRPVLQSDFRPVEFIEGWLAKRGLVRQDSESLFDAFARSLGMTSLALRQYFRERMAGRARVG
jgi:hypothetical protein